MIDVSKYTDNKWIYFNNLIYRGIISYHINAQKEKPIVFNGQCNFGYKISPWINNKIAQLELIHSLCSFSYIRIPFMEYYYKTVMISRKRIKDHEELYDRYKIPGIYKQRIEFILNGIKLPARVKESINGAGKLKVLYVGRDTEEKRVDLIASVAKEIIETRKLAAEFVFMGEVRNAIPEGLHPYCIFLGNKSEENEIDEIYRSCDVLIMLSTTEGFPMAIMEAMARGLSIVSTAVGEIPYHVISDQNGFLIDDTANNDSVFKQACSHIEKLIINRNLLADFRINNIAHANDNFGVERFNKQYRNLFKEAKQHFGG
jgi:glycosyltransferase involved in cell wall biosynthesis